MFGWTGKSPKPQGVAPESRVSPPTYRVEVRRHGGQVGYDLHFYGGGDFSPYCIESLIDMLRGEAHGVRGQYEVTLELIGACSAKSIEEVATRLSTAGIAGLRGVVRAAGHRDVPLEDARVRHLPAQRPVAPPRSS